MLDVWFAWLSRMAVICGPPKQALKVPVVIQVPSLITFAHTHFCHLNPLSGYWLRRTPSSRQTCWQLFSSASSVSAAPAVTAQLWSALQRQRWLPPRSRRQRGVGRWAHLPLRNCAGVKWGAVMSQSLRPGSGVHCCSVRICCGPVIRAYASAGSVLPQCAILPGWTWVILNRV